MARVWPSHRRQSARTTAVGAVITQLGDDLGERTKVIQNVYRTNVMLGLMRAHLGHHDDPAAYTRIVRDELARTNGRPVINWREHHYTGRVRRGRTAPEGSLFHLADYYQRIGEREQRNYWIGKQGNSMEKKLLEHNIFHFLNGYKPLTITTSATPSVVLTGLMLSDFPLIRREWDNDNPQDTRTIAATVSASVKWVCFEDPTHRFTASVLSRTSRLTGCQECQKVRGAAAHGKAATPREHLLRIRAVWGDFEEPDPVPVPVGSIINMDDDPGEDF